MTIDALSAANAYQNQLKMAKDAGDTSDADTSGSAGAGGSSFAQMLTDAARSAENALTQSEAHQLKTLTGADKAPGSDQLADMVTAVSNAELTLNTVVAIRDRVISAYNDIIKMSI